MHSKSDSTRMQPPEARGHGPRLPGHQEEGVVVDSDELSRPPRDPGADGARHGRGLFPIARPAPFNRDRGELRLRGRVCRQREPGPDARLLGQGTDLREHRIRPGRNPLRGGRAWGAVPSPERRQGTISARSFVGRDGNRELPRRAVARRPRRSAGPSRRIRREADARRQSSLARLSRLRGTCSSGIGAALLRAKTPRE